MFEIISLVLFVLLLLSIVVIVNLKKRLAFAWKVADYFREDNKLGYDSLRQDIEWIRYQLDHQE